MKPPDHRSNDQPILCQLELRPFQWVDMVPDSIVITFDRPSDTLLIHLFGRGRSLVSVPVDRYDYALVNSETEQTLGIHIEGFLAQEVKEHPTQTVLLDHAELRGITPIEVRELQREILGTWRALPGQVNVVYAQETHLDRKGAVLLLLHAEHPKWRTLGKPAA